MRRPYDPAGSVKGIGRSLRPADPDLDAQHCELVLEDGRFASSLPRDGGVRAKLIEPDPAVWDFLPLPWVREEVVEELLQAEQGAGYDWIGILGSQILPVGIQSESRWFCSEFCAQVIGLEQPQRYSPGSLAETARWVIKTYMNNGFMDVYL